MPKIEELTQKDLRRLGRRDLLVLMLEQARQTERLEQAMSELKEQYEQALKAKEQLLSELAAQKKSSAIRPQEPKLLSARETRRHADSEPRTRIPYMLAYFIRRGATAFLQDRQEDISTKRKR